MLLLSQLQSKPDKGYIKSNQVFVELCYDAKKYIHLTTEEIRGLENLVRTSPNFRVLSRNQSLLWIQQGKDRATIAGLLGIQADTVSRWHNKWLENKFESLVDLPTSGRPLLGIE